MTMEGNGFETNSHAATAHPATAKIPQTAAVAFTPPGS
jgi:hypothetical protein